MVSTAELAECLQATQQADPNTRVAAEVRLSEYFKSPDTGLGLAQIAVTQEADVPLRQAACIVLRKYVNERWGPYFQKFRGDAPPQEIKAQIRQTIFHGLSDPNSRIRSSCALTISSIASSDWPDEYPDLLTSLINLISSDSPNSVHGAMQVFSEFIKTDLTEDQILPVLRDLLPVLLNILGAKDVQSPVTRARTISVFRQCIISLYMVKEQHPQSVKEASASVLPVWLEAFRTLLSIDPVPEVSGAESWDALSIRLEIFRTLDSIHISFPKALGYFFEDLLTISLHHLQALWPAFQKYYLLSLDSPPTSSESDSAIDLTQLISAIIDFFSTAARGGRARTWFTPESTAALISTVFNYVQMTEIDEDKWAKDANVFVAQEEDEAQDYSVRVASFDLLACLVDRSPATTIGILNSAVQQVIQNRDTSKEDWWRSLEAALAAVGSVAEAIQDCCSDEEEEGRPKPIDIESLLTNVIPSTLTLTDHPFLQGRGFVFASQFGKLLPVQLAGQYLEAAILVIENDQATIPVRVSAVKAIHNFCQDGEETALVLFMPRVAKDLGPFLTNTSEDSLSLVLETLSVVLEVDDGKWLSQELARDLVVATLEVWRHNNRDPIFLSMFPDIVESLASAAYQTVVQAALPPLCEAMRTARSDEAFIAGSAIEIVQGLIKACPETGLGDGFFTLLGPNLFECLANTEDRDVLQNGVACLTTVVRKDCQQLLSWSDPAGQSGLEYVLRLIARLLQTEDEYGGLAIGELIIHLLRKAGESVLPVLPDLLQAMITRMQSAKTATFLQSLVIPFAFLINNQRDTILTLLEGISVNGRTGLDILVQTWCENAETFQGFWPTRTSTLGLSQLFVAERPSLQQLQVKGDIVVNPATKNIIMTRSRTKETPHQFTRISFPLKALKILIHDVRSAGESANIPETPGIEDRDSDDDDWEDEGGFEAKDNDLQMLSDLLGPKGIAFDNDDILEDSDDEDLKQDPISQINLQEHIVSFLKECVSRNTNNFSALADLLTVEELIVLRKMVQ